MAPNVKTRTQGSPRQVGKKFVVTDKNVADVKKLATEKGHDRIQDIAEGKVPPKTVEEAKAALAYMEAKRHAQEQQELEAKKAIAAFEAGSDDIHRVRRALSKEQIKRQAKIAEIEAKRSVRKAVSGALHSFFSKPKPEEPKK